MAPKKQAQNEPQAQHEAYKPELPYTAQELAAEGRKHPAGEALDELIQKHRQFAKACHGGADYLPADLDWVNARLKLLRAQQD